VPSRKLAKLWRNRIHELGSEPPSFQPSRLNVLLRDGQDGDFELVPGDFANRNDLAGRSGLRQQLDELWSRVLLELGVCHIHPAEAEADLNIV
jgi:hypothetical protein